MAKAREELASPSKQAMNRDPKARHGLTLWFAGVLLYGNHQRPVAIAKATLREYENARMVEEGRKKYMMSNHKMGTTGRAKIIVAPLPRRVRSESKATNLHGKFTYFLTLKGNL